MACRAPNCPYPNLVMPSGSKSPLCAYHRLLRTSVDAQIREAERRLAAADDPHRTRVPARDWPAGERFCAGCQSMIPTFYTSGSRCKACAAKATREQRRMSTYGLTPEAFADLMTLQDGRCAICRKRQTDRSIAVDHSHSSGEVRGLLCLKCNRELLGAAYDSLRMVLAAAIYLAAPPTSGDWIDPEIGGDAVMESFLESLK